MKDFTDIIIAPVITEKAAIQAEANVYTFKVAADANKIEIKKAVKNLNIYFLRILFYLEKSSGKVLISK